MSRSNTVKFFDELRLSAKQYDGSAAYKRLQVDGVNSFIERNFDVIEFGTTTSTLANNLVNSGASFTAEVEGKSIHNTTDNTYAVITSFENSTTLILSADIMISGDDYEIVERIVGNDVIIVPVTSITKEVVIKVGNGADITFDAGTPVGMGQRVSGADNLIVNITTGLECAWVSGDVIVFDILVDYEELSTDNEITLKYVENKSGSTPDFTRPIKEKGIIQHRKHNLDPDRTMSISQKYQARDEGLLKVSGQDYILKAERRDDDYLVSTEIDYYYQCYHDAPEPNGSTGATDSTVDFEVMYERRASLAI